MKTFITFRIDRGLAIRQFQALFVSNSEVVDGEFIAPAPDGWRSEDGLDVLVFAGGNAIVDPALALSAFWGAQEARAPAAATLAAATLPNLKRSRLLRFL